MKRTSQLSSLTLALVLGCGGGSGPGVDPDECVSDRDCAVGFVCEATLCVPSRDRRDGGAGPLDDAGGGLEDGGGLDDGSMSADAGPTEGFDREPTEPVEAPPRGAIVGRVRGQDGAALAGVEVRVGTDRASSDRDGRFSLEVAAGEHVAHFTLDGYVGVHRRFRVRSWERVTLTVVMMAEGESGEVDPAAGGRVGGVIVDPGTGFIGPDGVRTLGRVSVTFTPIDPATDDLEAGPGDLVGRDPESGREDTRASVESVPAGGLMFAPGDTLELVIDGVPVTVVLGPEDDTVEEVAARINEATVAAGLGPVASAMGGTLVIASPSVGGSSSVVVAGGAAAGPLDLVGAESRGLDDADPLVSVGMADVQFEDMDGRPVEPDEPVDVVIPAPEGWEPGDEVPWWRFDEPSGEWVLEGTAVVEVRDGVTVFVGEATQSGTWNCDLPETPVCVQGRVVDCAGYGIPGAEMLLLGTGTTSRGTAFSGPGGYYEVCGATTSGMGFVRATLEVAGATLVSETPVLTLSDPVYTGADAIIAFEDLRYLAAMVAASSGRTVFDVGMPIDRTSSSATGTFWDVGSSTHIVGACSGLAADDSLRLLTREELGGSAEAPTPVDVGNPLVLSAGAARAQLFRYVVDGALTGYETEGDAGLSASELDLTIPGGVGTVPFTVLPAALRIPEAVELTSARSGSFDRSEPLPLRWAGPSRADTVVSIQIFGMAEDGPVLSGLVNDDGSFDVDLSVVPFSGPALVTVGRVHRNVASLPTGPGIELVGSSSFSFLIELR